MNNSNSPDVTPPLTPLRCFVGALISGGLGFVLYQLTAAIALSFASKPIAANSYLAANIGAAVRTLVVGSCTLATFLFGISALGLVALGIQLWFKPPQPDDTASNSPQD